LAWTCISVLPNIRLDDPVEGGRIAMASTQDHRVQADVMAHPSVLAQNIFGVGIDGGRSWNMYFGSDQYIGDICDGREMNGYSGLGCM
jgi:hypothetical protein